MSPIVDYNIIVFKYSNTVFKNYLTTFVGTDYSSYSVKKSTGKEFTEYLFNEFGKNTFEKCFDFG
mgnify:CR=1 FL=1